MQSKTTFPKQYMLRKIGRKRRERFVTVHTLLHGCNSVVEFKTASRNLTDRTRGKIEYMTREQSECED